VVLLGITKDVYGGSGRCFEGFTAGRGVAQDQCSDDDADSACLLGEAAQLSAVLFAHAAPADEVLTVVEEYAVAVLPQAALRPCHGFRVIEGAASVGLNLYLLAIGEGIQIGQLDWPAGEAKTISEARVVDDLAGSDIHAVMGVLARAAEDAATDEQMIARLHVQMLMQVDGHRWRTH